MASGVEWRLGGPRPWTVGRGLGLLTWVRTAARRSGCSPHNHFVQWELPRLVNDMRPIPGCGWTPVRDPAGSESQCGRSAGPTGRRCPSRSTCGSRRSRSPCSPRHRPWCRCNPNNWRVPAQGRACRGRGCPPLPPQRTTPREHRCCGAHPGRHDTVPTRPRHPGGDSGRGRWPAAAATDLPHGRPRSLPSGYVSPSAPCIPPPLPTTTFHSVPRSGASASCPYCPGSCPDPTRTGWQWVRCSATTP